MERYFHIILSTCVALIISLAGFVELEHMMRISATPVNYINIVESQIEEYTFESESVGNISSVTRLRNNSCPVRHFSSRTPIRTQIQQRTVKGTTFKLGKTLDCRTIIAQSVMQGLLPMATKSRNRLIIRIHKLSIEP